MPGHRLYTQGLDAVRNGLDVDGEGIYLSADIAHHFAVGALFLHLGGDKALNDKLGMGRHQKVIGFAFYELYGLAAEARLQGQIRPRPASASRVLLIIQEMGSMPMATDAGTRSSPRSMARSINL